MELNEVRSKSAVDAAYTQLVLTSGFFFYPFKEISIRRLRIPELKKIHRASVTESMRTLIEAVGMTLDQPVLDLTVGDLWFCLYWLRLNSYVKSPYTVNFVCDNKRHRERTEPLYAGEDKVDPQTLENSVIVSASNIQVVEIEDSANDFSLAFLARTGLQLSPLTVRDFLAIQDKVRESDNKIDPEDDYILTYASALSPSHGTLEERAKIVEEALSPDDLLEIDDFQLMIDHGVREQFNVECKECKAKKTVHQSLNALHFFP